MNRKEFLAGASATAAIVLVRNIGWAAQQPAETKPAAPPSGTPVQEKYAFSQQYIKRLMDVIDQQLTAEQRAALLVANGRACYRSAHGTGSLPGGLDELVRAIQTHNGADTIRREGNTIHFRYVKNQDGLRVEDGYCLCPLVEQGPPGLSGTFCHCSVGYVTEMFSIAAGKPVKVELTESLKRGGKACRFVVQV